MGVDWWRAPPTVTGLTFAAAVGVRARAARARRDRDRAPLPAVRPVGEAVRAAQAADVPPGLLTDLTHILVNNVLTHRRGARAGRRRGDPVVLDPPHRPRRRPARGAAIALAVALVAVGNYWGHRLTHQVPFLWRFHSVHHSIEQMDWVASGRLHPLDQAFTQAFTIFPLFAARLRRRRVRRRRGVHHPARAVPARQRAAALPRSALGDQHAGVAPLAPRDRRRRARQELRAPGRRQDLRHRVPAEGRAAGRVRHALAGARRRLPAPPRVPVHRGGEGWAAA